MLETFPKRDRGKNSDKWLKTRKLLTVDNALHPKDDIDRQSRKESGRGLASIEG